MGEELKGVVVATVKVEFSDIPKLKALIDALAANFDKLPTIVKSRVNDLLIGEVE